MGFWFFMLGMDLLLPIVLILVGKSFLKSSPKDINCIYGYRTSMSMKNQDTWAFAHRFCGKLWFWSGWILLPVSVVPLLFVIGKSRDVIGTVGTVVEVADLIVLVASIIPTEIALKKTFDENGNRKTDPDDSGKSF